jgi:hypothetical protein
MPGSQKFKDGKGREWLISLDIATVERVYAATKFNIYDLLKGPEGGAKLAADPSLHLSVIYELVRKQAEDRQVDPKEFKEQLGTMDALEEIGDAFEEALISFSPSRRRELLRKESAKQKALTTATLAESERLIDLMNPEKMAKDKLKKVRKELEDVNGPTGNAAPLKPAESAESTPTIPD